MPWIKHHPDGATVTLLTGATARRKTLLLAEIALNEAENSLIGGAA